MKRKTTEQFVQEARKIHGNKFDYSLVDYKNKNTKIKIICKHHNVFEQLPSNHLKGKGCLKCRGYDKTNDDIIREFREVHGNTYDYSLVEYRGAHNKVIIICHEHGTFTQSPSKHIQNRSCPECARAKRGRSYSKTINAGKFRGVVQPEHYKIIPLGNGVFTKVDNEDFDKVKGINWYLSNMGYVGSKRFGLIHRYIMNAPDGAVVDHIDNNPTNNRKNNLRICTQAENTRNRAIKEGYTSKYKGVCWAKNRNKWISYIGYENKSRHIGYFTNEIEAAKSYDKKAIELFGEFAHTNF